MSQEYYVSCEYMGAFLYRKLSYWLYSDREKQLRPAKMLKGTVLDTMQLKKLQSIIIRPTTTASSSSLYS